MVIYLCFGADMDNIFVCVQGQNYSTDSAIQEILIATMLNNAA